MINNPNVLRAWANRNILKNRVEITITTPGPSGYAPVAVGLPLIMKDVEDGGYFPGPTFELSIEEAQRLMDELWGATFAQVTGPGAWGRHKPCKRTWQISGTTL